MKINFTKKQFETLIELVYAGHWILNSHRNVEIEKYNEVEQLIYSFAKPFGLEHFIEFDKKLDGYYPTLEFEDSMEELIAEYDDRAFWDELVDRLALRDLTKEGIEGKSNEEIMERRIELEEKYEIEFEKHHLNRLKIEK